MRAAIYARFSSDMQREASIADQVRNCRAYAGTQGWEVSGEHVFTDEARSGATTSGRPGYLALMAAARARAFDVLIADDLSRLSRDAAETQNLCKRLRFLGIGLVAVSDGVNTIANPKSSNLIAAIKGAMNDEYLRDLGEKTHRGIAGRVLEGMSPGGLPYAYRSEPVCGDKPKVDRYGQPVPIGYRRMIVEDEAEVVRRIFEMYASGLSSRRIAEALNKQGVPPPGRRWRNREAIACQTWSMSAIEGSKKRGIGILNNQAYLGKIIWNRFEYRHNPDGRPGRDGRKARVPFLRPEEEWVVTPVPELRIVDDSLWQRVKAEQDRRSASRRRTGHVPVDGRSRYLLSGLLKCGACGARMVRRGDAGYGCATRVYRGKHLCSNNRVVNRQALEGMVLQSLRDELYERRWVSELVRMVRQRLVSRVKKQSQERQDGSIRAQHRQTEAEITNVVAAIKAGSWQDGGSVLAAELEKLAQRKKRLEGALETPEKAEDNVALLRILNDLPAVVRAYIDDIGGLLARSNVEKARSALMNVLREAVVEPGTTNDGRPCHIVRLRGDLEKTLRLLPRKVNIDGSGGRI